MINLKHMPQKPLFDYFIVSVECNLIPQEVYWLKEYSFAFFPSAEENSLASINHEKLGSQSFPRFGILIYRPKGELSLHIIKEVLDDFVTCICLLWPDYFLFSAIREFSEMRQQSFEKQIRTTVNIETAIKRSIYNKNDLKTTFGGALIDYSKLVYISQRNLQLNFFPIFQRFMSLDRNEKDYQAIKLLILASFLHPFIGKFYDNANMRYSLLFTLLESFLNKEERIQIYKCKKCGAEANKSIQVSVSDRFSQYVNQLPISDELKERAKKTFECMRPIRNKFYHYAESEGELGKKKDLRSITGRNTMTYKQDLELNGGREFGPNFMQDFIRTILLSRLLSEASSNKKPEFKESLLWNHFKPISVVGKVDVSFSDLIGYLHVGIMDFSELEKRIHLCKSEEICNDRRIRQFYFKNENSSNPIMIVCDTPSRLNIENISNDRESNWSKNNLNEPFLSILKLLNLEDAYMTNLVKCGSLNRFDITDPSLKNCWQFLLREIDLINPKLILCVGKTVFKIMSKRNLSVPVEYVPHYNYRMNKLTNSNRNKNNAYLRSEESIIKIWKAAIVKHIFN